jgi:hypothetical protein
VYAGPVSDDSMAGSARFVWFARATAVSGAGLISYGAWCAWPPAGLISAGVILLVVGIGALRA